MDWMAYNLHKASCKPNPLTGFCCSKGHVFQTPAEIVPGIFETKMISAQIYCLKHSAAGTYQLQGDITPRAVGLN